jgi:hypothetical protein
MIVKMHVEYSITIITPSQSARHPQLFSPLTLTPLNFSPFPSAVLEDLFGVELKGFRPVAPAATKLISNRFSLNLSAPVAKDDNVDTSDHPAEDSIEMNTLKIAQDRLMEAISIYSNNILHAYKEASSALRLASLIVEVGPLSYANVFERHTKVRTCCAFSL